MTINTAEEMINLILYTNGVLQEETDLSPNNDVINETLGNFVREVLLAGESKIDSSAVLSHPEVQVAREAMLPRLWEAESAMEHYFADHFINGNTQPQLTDFLYLDNYTTLVKEEVRAIEGVLKESTSPRKIAFVGSGPLPLSALFLHQDIGADITCIDFDEEASEKGGKFIDLCGCSDQIDSICADGRLLDYSEYDLVFIATMIGDKVNTVQQIQQTADEETLIAVRSVEGFRTLLYHPLNSNEIAALTQNGRQLLGQAYATPNIINCTPIFGRAVHSPNSSEYKEEPTFLSA